MATETTKIVTPAYGSYKTFLGMLNRLAETDIPQRIDRTYWGGFLNGSTGQQTMATLRFLGLVDSNGIPAPILSELVSQETRKETLAALLRARYADAMALADPSRSTLGQLQSAFHTAYKLEGETLRKAITFFTQAAQDAGLPLSNMIVGSLKSRSPSSSTIRRATPKRDRHSDTDSASTSGTPHGSKSRKTPLSTPPSPGLPVKVVTFRNGETLTLLLDGNFLMIDPTDRAFLNQLLEFIEAHERGETNKQAAGEDSAFNSDDIPF